MGNEDAQFNESTGSEGRGSSLADLMMRLGTRDESVDVSLYTAMGEHNVLARHGNVIIERVHSPADKTIPAYYVREIGPHGKVVSERIYANSGQVAEDLTALENWIASAQSGVDMPVLAGVDPEHVTRKARFLNTSLLNLDGILSSAEISPRRGVGGVEVLPESPLVKND
jgi:hypothetical protein